MRLPAFPLIPSAFRRHEIEEHPLICGRLILQFLPCPFHFPTEDSFQLDRIIDGVDIEEAIPVKIGDVDAF